MKLRVFQNAGKKVNDLLIFKGAYESIKYKFIFRHFTVNSDHHKSSFSLIFSQAKQFSVNEDVHVCIVGCLPK